MNNLQEAKWEQSYFDGEDYFEYPNHQECAVCPNCDGHTFTVFRDFDGVVEKLICSECHTILYV